MRQITPLKTLPISPESRHPFRWTPGTIELMPE